MVVGFILLLIGVFLFILGAKGTYYDMPPFPGSQSEKISPIREMSNKIAFG